MRIATMIAFLALGVASLGAQDTSKLPFRNTALPIEERINEVLQRKREMFNTIFSETATPSSSGLTQDEIFGLFKLRTPKGPIKRVA